MVDQLTQQLGVVGGFREVAPLFTLELIGAPCLISLGPALLAILLRRFRAGVALAVLGPALTLIVPYILAASAQTENPLSLGQVIMSLAVWPIAGVFAVMGIVVLLYLETQRDPKNGRRRL